MALVKCNHCKKEINNKKDNCLWCGKPISEELKDIKDKDLTEKEKEEKEHQRIQFQVSVEYKKKYEWRNRVLSVVISAVISFIVCALWIVWRNIDTYPETARLGLIEGLVILAMVWVIKKITYFTIESSYRNRILKRIEKELEKTID